MEARIWQCVAEGPSEVTQAMDRAELIVEPDWLAAHLSAPELRVIDASWYLPAEDRDARADFAEAHIPGAVHLDLSADLADPGAAVRNTLASPAGLAAAFGRAGIGNEHHVVVYDRKSGYSAGRIWWTLKYLGHERASLLDGGFGRWQQLGLPVSNRIGEPKPETYVPRPRPELLRDAASIRESLGSDSLQLVDARSAERFRGEGVEPALNAGHIPGSINVPHDANLNPDPPGFRSMEELRRVYEQAGVRFDRPVVTTCGSGVTASLNAFVLIALGHPDVSVYDGSWAEWGNDPSLPFERGP